MKLSNLFSQTQTMLASQLEASRLAFPHPVAKGDASETSWLTMLKEHLPHRYRADRVFVVDSAGGRSEQIDVVIFDRQYTPVLYTNAGGQYVPAESVYAVFEVKQKINARFLAAAGKKAASVRRLVRTSAGITHAGGQFKAQPPKPILAGILAYESSWKPSFGEKLKEHLTKAEPEARLDLGCAVRDGSFEVKAWQGSTPQISISAPETALVGFFLRLLARLQGLGTVTAIQYDNYLAALNAPAVHR
jgi:hypothetical protein